MHQAGFTNAVASLGTALTQQQASLMKRYTNEVLLLYDSDEAGQKAAMRGIPILRQAGLSPKVVSLKPYKDPDEFIKAEGAAKFEERLENARNGFLFQVDVVRKEYDIQDPQGQTNFFHKVASMLLEFEDEIERNSYLEAVSREYLVKADMLQRLVNKLAMRGNVPEQVKKASETPTKKPEKKNGYEMAQKLLLTWIVTYPGIFDELMTYVSPDDFTNPLYRNIAQMLVEQRKNGDVNPARLLNAFTESEDQREAAAVFNARIHLETPEERLRALTDVICRIKESSIAYRTEHLEPTDMQGLMKIMEDKRKLEDLKGRKVQLHISFD